MERFYSHGKLLISGEYAVLDGAKSFGLPTKFGQSLEVSTLDTPVLIWESFNCLHQLWFQTELKLNELHNTSKLSQIATLQNILLAAQKLNPAFLNDGNGAFVQTFLTFPNEWGLGTSSTLINNIASWANVDAFALLKNSFGGSGYDIACAQNHTPVIYQIKEGIPAIEPTVFSKLLHDNIYFVYLNQKQNSKEGIAFYKSKKGNKEQFIRSISMLTEKIASATELTTFENLLKEHEQLIGDFLNITPIQQQIFDDFPGAVKSLGAWGGDFVLATGNNATPAYFESKGFDTVIPYKEMIL